MNEQWKDLSDLQLLNLTTLLKYADFNVDGNLALSAEQLQNIEKEHPGLLDGVLADETISAESYDRRDPHSIPPLERNDSLLSRKGDEKPNLMANNPKVELREPSAVEIFLTDSAFRYVRAKTLGRVSEDKEMIEAGGLPRS